MADRNDSDGFTRFSQRTQNIIIGLIMLVILIGVVGSIIFWVTYFGKRDYEVNKSLAVPVVDKLDDYTNDNEVVVTGRTEEGARVILFVNGKDSGEKTKAARNGKFEFRPYRVEDGKTYKFRVAQLSGGLFKKERSKLSNEEVVVVDMTVPSGSVVLDKTATTSVVEEITITGKAEEGDIDVVAKRGTKEYVARSDKDGNFAVNVKLAEGENKIKILLRDQAENETDTGKVITVKYEPTLAEGDVNGDGVGTGGGSDADNLPNSAGELKEAANFLLRNFVVTLVSAVALMLLAFVKVGKLVNPGESRK